MQAAQNAVFGVGQVAENGLWVPVKLAANFGVLKLDRNTGDVIAGRSRSVARLSQGPMCPARQTTLRERYMNVSRRCLSRL